MATTFAQIKARVEAIVIDTNTAVVAEVGGFVRKAQAEIEDNRALQALWGVWITTLGDGDNTLTKPSDYNGLRISPYRTEGDGTFTALELIGLEATLLGIDFDETGTPRLFVDTSISIFQVYPKADGNGPSSGNWQVNAGYWKRLDTLTADSDTNWLCDNAEDYLVWRAASLSLGFNEDAREMKYAAMAAREMKRLRGAEIRGRFSGLWSLKPTPASELGSRRASGRAFKPSDPSIHGGPI